MTLLYHPVSLVQDEVAEPTEVGQVRGTLADQLPEPPRGCNHDFWLELKQAFLLCCRDSANDGHDPNIAWLGDCLEVATDLQQCQRKTLQRMTQRMQQAV